MLRRLLQEFRHLMYVNASIKILSCVVVVLCADGTRVDEGHAYRLLRCVSIA